MVVKRPISHTIDDLQITKLYAENDPIWSQSEQQQKDNLVRDARHLIQFDPKIVETARRMWNHAHVKGWQGFLQSWDEIKMSDPIAAEEFIVDMSHVLAAYYPDGD